METERLHFTLLLLLVSIISAFNLVPPCAAQSGYEIRSAQVTPEYGYEDFTYSIQVWMSEEAAREVGLIAVTKFSMKLNIYDQNQLVYSESSPSQTGMSKTSFVFGPYSFRDRFGITSTSNATFEFIFYAGGQQVAKTARIKGPIVQPPTLTGTPSFEKKPYFFQGIAVSAGFKDMEGLSPKPTCHLEITGPLGTAESRSWTTADVSCQSTGKSTYTCTVAEDLSSYRNGGEFTFKLVYNNLKLDPLNYGPYNISLQPYNPVIEKFAVPKLLDYTNFTIQAYVKDAGAKMVGGTPDGSTASLIISHPQKGEMTYASSEPKVQGSSLVYEWTRENIPALFNRSDVQLAKNAPFLAKVVYSNENWDYQAEKSNISFRVVEEIPKLDLQYPSTVYVRAGESTAQDIIATVTFSKGLGDMNLQLSGPDQDLNLTEKGVSLGGNRYQYKWSVAFDDRYINNNYTLGLSFAHPTLEGGRYAFEDKFIRVLPLSVQFPQADVSPITGLWNDSYTYSLKIDTTIVPLEVRLQTYDPCSSEWTDKGSQKATVESSWLNWTLSPFSYDCIEMQQEGAKYRFKASFAGKDYFSKPYQGPTFNGGSPVLISLDSDPVVYVTEGSESSSSIAAVVEYAAGQGQATLRLTGPEKNIEETSQGIALGGNQYRYDWSLPFEETDIGKSFNYTISYKHPSIAGEIRLAEKEIAAKAISISFGNATVAPVKGKWNETYDYSVAVKSSVDMKVALEVYNPCSKEWVERSSGTATSGKSFVNLTARPFKYKCSDAEGKEAGYRFVAGFAEARFESEVYSGPLISGGKPELVSLDYTPILYVTEDVPVYQVVKAIVDSPLGQGAVALSINGPEMNFTEVDKGAFLSGQRYAYTWSIPFGVDNAGNHTLSLRYLHPEIAGGEISYPVQNMRVMNTEAKKKDEIIKFDQASVTPANGSIFTGFTYCVDVVSDLKNYDVELFTQEPGSIKWVSQGTIPYNGTSQALCWPEVVIDGSHYGKAKYRFSSGLSTSDIFEGPSIEPVSFINATISPTHGPLYITTPLLGEISRVYMYTITVQFMKPLAGNMREVKLEVYDPSSESWLYAGSQTYDASKTKIVFKVNFAGLPFQEPFLGETKYRLLAYSENLGEFVGPTIDVNLKNERAIASGKNYTYQLEVRSSLPKVDIALAYTKNNVNWLKGDKRTYESSNQEWKALKWEKYPKHYAYEFEVAYA
ncbi:MAG: hypothetical protein WAW52_08485 [Methanothrix sp.]